MVMTDEEKKAYKNKYMREWKKANRDKVKESKRREYLRHKERYLERAKKRYAENTEQIKQQFKTYAKNNKEKIKAYRQTDEYKKISKISTWRSRGVNNVTDELYDYFMNCENCEACGKEFTETINKCLDHNHETGEFRFVLCRGCNTHDNWKKVISHTDNQQRHLER